MFMLSGGSSVHVSRARTRRTVVTIVALGAVAAATFPAGATTTTTPSHGKATSTLSLLQLRIAGQTVTAGRIAAVAGNASAGHVAKLVVTPLDSTATGPIGQQTITPSQSTTVPPTPRSISLPSGLGSVTGPTFVAQAADSATSVLATARLRALGGVTLAGVPLSLGVASLGHTARVVSSNATAQKSLSLGNLALPSVNDLLAALGLDISKLSQDQLTQLAGVVGTVSSAVTTLNTQIDALQPQVSGAPDTSAAAQAAVTSATTALQTQLNALNAALQDATTGPATTTALTTALASAGLTLPTVPITVAAWQLLSPAEQTVIATFSDTTLSTTIASANTAVDQAQQLLAALASLLTQVSAALDGDPLAVLGGIKLTTKAVAAATPSAVALLSVANTDVLGAARQLSQVTGALSQVTGALATVLNSIPGVQFTPPSITMGTATKSTHRSGTTRFATASLRAVTVTLPTLRLSGAALPLAMPGGVNSGAGTLVLGVTTESAQWTPPVSHTSTSGSPVPESGQQLGDTGGRLLLPILATIVLGVAVAVRRRWSAA
jgi:hypothetical protein